MVLTCTAPCLIQRISTAAHPEYALNQWLSHARAVCPPRALAAAEHASRTLLPRDRVTPMDRHVPTVGVVVSESKVHAPGTAVSPSRPCSAVPSSSDWFTLCAASHSASERLAQNMALFNVLRDKEPKALRVLVLHGLSVCSTAAALAWFAIALHLLDEQSLCSGHSTSWSRRPRCAPGIACRWAGRRSGSCPARLHLSSRMYDPMQGAQLLKLHDETALAVADVYHLAQRGERARHDRRVRAVEDPSRRAEDAREPGVAVGLGDACWNPAVARTASAARVNIEGAKEMITTRHATFVLDPGVMWQGWRKFNDTKVRRCLSRERCVLRAEHLLQRGVCFCPSSGYVCCVGRPAMT